VGATYGPKDVKAQIEKMYKAGTRSFIASNKIWGDPLIGVVKTLTIEYGIGGKLTVIKSVVEGSNRNITIPDGEIGTGSYLQNETLA
jgi:hypothetical protein